MKASIYYQGNGVPVDYKKARQWYEKAAAQGHPHAQLGLGTLYANGHGVRKNHTKAKVIECWAFLARIPPNPQLT